MVYDPAAIPADTPFDPNLETSEPNPLSSDALLALAAEGRALVLHFPVEDCEATLRIVVGQPPPAAGPNGRLVLERARLRLPSGHAVADGAEFLHAAGQVRKQALGETTRVPPGDYAVSVLNLIPWKLAHRHEHLAAATTPSARRFEALTTVIALSGAVLIPLNVLLAPLAVAVTWRARGFRTAAIVAGCIVTLDALVLVGAKILQTMKRRFPALDEAAVARLQFDRDNPGVIVVLEPWAGGDPKPAWATLAVR